MKHINRPEKIETILNEIDSHFPDDIGVALEGYIFELEAIQKDAQPDDASSFDTDYPPIWSHAQQEKRAQRRRERSARNRKAYQ